MPQPIIVATVWSRPDRGAHCVEPLVEPLVVELGE